MVTQFNLVYSASAAIRLLGIGPYLAKLVRVEQWASVIWVHIPGALSRFVSKSAFHKHFAQWRQRSGRGLQVTQRDPSVVDSDTTLGCPRPGCYSVRNEQKNTTYQVKRFRDRTECECDDYHNQREFLGRGICKHGYALLASFGLGSLQEYLAREQLAPSGSLA